MILGLTSPGNVLNNDYVGNYANSTLRDRLLRIEGVGTSPSSAAATHSMRVWIDPAKAAARGLNATDIVGALRGQNIQAAAGSIGQPPFATNASAFQQPIQVQGRLSNPDEFAEIVIKTDAEGRVTRVRRRGACRTRRAGLRHPGLFRRPARASASPLSSSQEPTPSAPQNG